MTNPPQSPDSEPTPAESESTLPLPAKAAEPTRDQPTAELVTAADAPAATSSERPPTSRMQRLGRSTLSAVLIVLGVLCLTLSPVTIWGRNLILNTDRYVQTLAPVASDPGVQAVVIKAVDKQVEANLDVQSLIEQTLPPRAQVLAGPLGGAINGLVNTVATRIVESPQFAQLWVQANRAAHKQIVFALTGDLPPGAAGIITTHNGIVSLDVSGIVNAVKQQLVSAGLTVAQQVPVVGTTIEIANVHGLEKARHAVRVLNTVADWLPWLGLVLVAAGIAAALRRRRALIRSAAGLAAGMIVMGIGLLIARHFYLNAVPPDKLPPDTAKYLFNTVVRYLRLSIRLVLLFSVIVMIGAWLAGPGNAAGTTRTFLSNGLTRIAAAIAATPAGPFITAHAMAIRVGVIGLGLIVFVLWGSASLIAIIVVAVCAAIVLLAFEGLRTVAARTPIT